MAVARVLFLAFGIAAVVYGLHRLQRLGWRRPPAEHGSEELRRDWLLAASLLLAGVVSILGVFTGEVDRELTSDFRVGRDFSASIIDLLHPGVVFHTAVRFKEVLVNLFDLLSFIFVTPEIVERYSRSPTFSHLVGIASFAVALVSGAALFWLFMSAMIYTGGANHTTMWPISSTWSMQHSSRIAAVIVALLVPAAISIYVQFDEPLSLPAARRWLLKCGVVLFLASRLFGIAAGLSSEEPPRPEHARLSIAQSEADRTRTHPARRDPAPA